MLRNNKIELISDIQKIESGFCSGIVTFKDGSKVICTAIFDNPAPDMVSVRVHKQFLRIPRKKIWHAVFVFEEIWDGCFKGGLDADFILLKLDPETGKYPYAGFIALSYLRENFDSIEELLNTTREKHCEFFRQSKNVLAAQENFRRYGETLKKSGA